jgi:AhpD family alkylhydroperoxidase
VRIEYGKVMPHAMDAMLGLQRAADAAGLEPRLVELVKIRASQLNGCAYCLDMHTKDARAIGEDEDRLHLVAAWREAPCFSERERAALAWTESLTLLPASGAPDEVYEEARSCFSEAELVGLTFEIVAINGWNRLAVSMRTPVGTYVSRRKPGTPG